ncbi:hypothetical protein TUM19329_10070 [Legionella antarctica]|uniref:Uncharacterized protein n=1 Tax=Legionella antarctica TaxID=2708020 RepID=A0A6F8T3V5_9GAMM|nr:hypothetical protein [Legionella antarctica]BCA94646.1 hypothetical protein TUM19329_10070 [Legionella antarctica]
MQDSKAFERKPRTMLIAGQNETVRKTASQHGFPATVGLIGCVALIIADKKSNVSLTHVDSSTDLSFIAGEIEFMDGEFTIDLIRGKGELYREILAVLEAMGFSDIQPSGKNRVVESNEGTVVFNYLKGVPQVFSFNDFKDIATPGVQPGATNRLHSLGYNAQTCVADPLKFQLRVYTRQLNHCLSSVASALPVLVHDASGWLETDVQIDREVQVILDKGKIGQDRFFSSGKMDLFHYIYPSYKALVEHLESETKIAHGI